MVDNRLSEAPLDFSRFFPRYKMQDLSPTPLHTLKETKRIAQEEGIQHVYLGNV
jgi:pyruvate formate lyase activating enzyme